MAMAIMVTSIILSGCKKDDGGKLESGWFDGVINATIENEAHKDVGKVGAWNNCSISEGTLYGNPLGGLSNAVTFSNKSFTINLPDPPPAGMAWFSIKDYFEENFGMDSKVKYSDPDVEIMDVDFIALNSAITGYYGYFMQTASDGKSRYGYFYAKSDVTVTGASNLTVSFERGWNRLFISSKLITTKAQKGLNWQFFTFN